MSDTKPLTFELTHLSAPRTRKGQQAPQLSDRIASLDEVVRRALRDQSGDEPTTTSTNLDDKIVIVAQCPLTANTYAMISWVHALLEKALEDLGFTPGRHVSITSAGPTPAPTQRHAYTAPASTPVAA